MYKRILVPVDGSRTATRALREAMRLAKDQKGKLRLLCVLDDSVLMPLPEGTVHVPEIYQALEDGGRAVIRKAMAEVRKQGLHASAILYRRLSPVANIIVQQARCWHADLIVLGTHGRRGIKRMVMGSDAEAVLRSATVPVLLVSPKMRNVGRSR
jgi:nucleotide-binding universal stress UspA family protein